MSRFPRGGAVPFLLFLLAAGSVFCLPRLYLTAADESGRVVYMRPVRRGERYTVRFIHSVARTPVDEIYEIGEDCSILRETVYDMMGAGLPAGPGEGQVFSTENGKYRLGGFSLKIPVLTYRIDKVVADHTLLMGKDVFQLRRWVSAPGKPLSFRVEKASLAGWLRFRGRSYLRSLEGGKEYGQNEQEIRRSAGAAG